MKFQWNMLVRVDREERGMAREEGVQWVVEVPNTGTRMKEEEEEGEVILTK